MRISLHAPLFLLVGAVIVVTFTLIVSVPGSSLVGQSRPKPTPSPTPRRPLPKAPAGARGFEQYAKRDASARLIAATATRPLDPANAYYELGSKAYNAARYQKAVEDFSQAVNLSPEWAEAHYGLAVSLTEIGKLKEAIAQFKQVLKLKATQDLQILSNYNMGNAYFDLGQHGDAIEAYKRANEINATSPQPQKLSKPHNNLGLAYAASGKLIEAVAEFNQAIQLRGNHSEAHYNLGVAYLQSGRRPEAEEQQRLLVRLNRKLSLKLEALLKIS